MGRNSTSQYQTLPRSSIAALLRKLNSFSCLLFSESTQVPVELAGMSSKVSFLDEISHFADGTRHLTKTLYTKAQVRVERDEGQAARQGS